MERKPRRSTPVRRGVPWLVTTCPTDRKVQTFCTIGPNGTRVELKSIPELYNNEIQACYHGWLLLANGNHRLWSLWNPTTYDWIKLPPLYWELTETMNIRSCIFTTSPKNHGCRVMIFDCSTTTIVYCQVGDERWTKHDYRSDLLEIGVEENKVGSLLELACLDGVIYANASYTHMLAIAFDNQTGLIEFERLGFGPPDLGMFTGRSYTHLVESFGELYAVYVFVHENWDQIFGIKVFRLDFSRKVWVEVENLDGRLLFLAGKWNCTSCLATTETGIRGNRIYFTIREDKHLYMYDLEEGTILDSLPCPRLQTLWYKSFWVMPECRHIDDQANVEPEYKISTALEQHHTKVEVQAPTDMEVSVADQYPLDIFTEIASNLGPLDYLEFRATCRLFRSAALGTQQSIKSVTSSVESPWLVTFRHNKSIFSFTDPKHNNTYSMKVPKSLQGTYICSSKDGYLILVDGLVDGKNLFYFNPFTNVRVQLPTPFTYYNRLSFSSSPSLVGCQIVRMDEYTSEVSFVQLEEDDVIINLDEHDWDAEANWDWEALEEGDNRGFNVNGPGVFHEGMFYFLGEKGNLGVLKIDGDDFSWEVLVKPEAPCNAFQHAYLMKCNGELMAVFVGRYGNWVKVFRLDHSEMIWVRVRNLGNNTLFISNISSFAAVARSSEMENKIYFSRFYDERIVYYSLRTKKFHTHGSDVALENFVDTKEQLYSTWIEPSLD